MYIPIKYYKRASADSWERCLIAVGLVRQNQDPLGPGVSTFWYSTEPQLSGVIPG